MVFVQALTLNADNRLVSYSKYRADIDGLRAIAVTSVVLFHAFPKYFPGGYLGVDIFFCISGYLISTVIFENFKTNTFSFFVFYIRRIRRIFPALILVLIATTILSWFTLLSDDFRLINKHTVAATLFVENFLLWSESGYFDTDSKFKPLLHLWSLGVEEQFYLLWPFILWVSWKSKANLFVATIFILAISFCANFIFFYQFDAAFYSPVTRFWELLMGASLAWLNLNKNAIAKPENSRLNSMLNKVILGKNSPEQAQRNRNFRALYGLLLTMSGMLLVMLGYQSVFATAFLPVLGATSLISAGPHAWINRVILSNRVLVWFGLISYPLYLWHWPLLSILFIVSEDEPTLFYLVLVIIVSIIAAWLSYKYFEVPVRFVKDSKIKSIYLVAAMVFISLSSYILYSNPIVSVNNREANAYLSYFENSLPQRNYFNNKLNRVKNWRAECSFVAEDQREVDFLVNSKPRAAIDTACYVRNAQFEKAVLLWGDSHAQQLSSGLKNNLPQNWQFLQVATRGCPQPVDLDKLHFSSQDQCMQSNFTALEVIRETKPEAVIVANFDRHSSEQFKRIADKLLMLGAKKVILLGPNPHWRHGLPHEIARSIAVYGEKNVPYRTYKGFERTVIAINEEIKENFKQDKTRVFANMIDFFCDQSGCLTHLNDNLAESTVIYDKTHLTTIGSDYFVKNYLLKLIVE